MNIRQIKTLPIEFFPADLQVQANLKLRSRKMTTGTVTTCYSPRVAFDLQKNPAYSNFFCTILITPEKSFPRLCSANDRRNVGA